MTEQADLYRALAEAARAVVATLDPDDWLRSPVRSLAEVVERRPQYTARPAPKRSDNVIDLASRRTPAV
jgi:hypothetical protein